MPFKFLLLIFFLFPTCQGSKQMIHLLSDSKWRDLFSNQSGKDLYIEIAKLSDKGAPIGITDSTELRIISIQYANGSPLPNPGGAGITYTGNLDLTLDGSTKILVVPKGFKVIGMSSQNGTEIILRKGYIFSKNLKTYKYGTR